VNPLEQGALYVSIGGIVVLCGVLSFCSTPAHGAATDMTTFRAVMCPPNWRATISQRYDDRDRWDWIVRRTWITRCY
jgi:hypothetical protein